MKPRCRWSGCITLLGRYSNPDYCHAHTRPHDQDEVQLFVEKLRAPGQVPLGHYECADCGRAAKNGTSCVCRATAAPREGWAA